MNDLRFNELREASWRRPLTASEEAELQTWLAAHPEARSEWDSDVALNQDLMSLPDAPMPSNFTARVLQAVEREFLVRGRHPSHWRWVSRFLPHFAVGATIACLGVIYYQQHQSAQRNERAQVVATVSENVAVMPDRDLLRDIEPIRRLGESSGPDETLLALME
jgi:anti-sigma factor RsiW